MFPLPECASQTHPHLTGEGTLRSQSGPLPLAPCTELPRIPSPSFLVVGRQERCPLVRHRLAAHPSLPFVGGAPTSTRGQGRSRRSGRPWPDVVLVGSPPWLLDFAGTSRAAPQMLPCAQLPRADSQALADLGLGGISSTSMASGPLPMVTGQFTPSSHAGACCLTHRGLSLTPGSCAFEASLQPEKPQLPRRKAKAEILQAPEGSF